jgi:hypothetical protein
MQTQRYYKQSDRVKFDFDLCHFKRGYAQVDTSQDAIYFGTWANPEKLAIITYCEGDVTIQQAETPAEFAEELRHIKAWNEEHGHGFKGIDDMGQLSIRNGFIAAGIADLLYQER